MPTEQDIRNFTATVEDAVTYPILTRETSGYESRGASTQTATGTATGKLAQQTIREVLGWRVRPGDTKGFMAALNKAFVLKEVEGHTEWDWKPQSYMLQADLGEITGAQASVHKQATVALEQALPLLDGLKPLRADADVEDTEAMRAIIRTELTELVNELALIGGPRVQRVDSFFAKLLGHLPPKSFDPEHVSGQLDRLRHRFGLSRARVNTIVEEQTLTNFLILVDYVNSLYQSWASKRDFFTGKREPFLGTQLVLLSQVLDAILEQLRETYDAMDSVFFGPAERQTVELDFKDGPMTVAEILSWVESFASGEGRQLLQAGGKDGVVIFRATIEHLAELMTEAASQAAVRSINPVPPFHTARVANALGELATYLNTATTRASAIRRRPVSFAEVEGGEENLPWMAPQVAIPYQPKPEILKLVIVAHRTNEQSPWVPHISGEKIKPGYSLQLRALGQNLYDISWDFGLGIEVMDIKYYPSGQQATATLKVKSDAPAGTNPVVIRDAYNQVHSLPAGVTIAAGAPPAPEPLPEAQVVPDSAYQGECKSITLTGEKLAGVGVSFGPGIHVVSTTYLAKGYTEQVETMRLDLEIAATAQTGSRDLTLFTSDRRSRVLRGKFTVEPKPPSPTATFSCKEASTPTCECKSDPEATATPVAPTTGNLGETKSTATQSQSPKK